MEKKTLLVCVMCAVIFSAWYPPVVYAQEGGVNNGGTELTSGANTGPTTAKNTGQKLINPLGSGDCSTVGVSVCITVFLNKILDFAIQIGAIAVVLMLVYVGFTYVKVANSNPSGISKVHETLMWTVVGALILLGAKAISIGISATVQAIVQGN